MKIFKLYDTILDIYSLFTFRNRIHAKRDLTNYITRSENFIENFRLYEIGSFSEDDGKIELSEGEYIKWDVTNLSQE